MSLDGGGWTLVVVVSDDDSETWTWDNRTLWTTDRRTVGAIESRNRDYKNRGLHDIAFEDVMFRHNPSEIWASYHDVGQGDRSFATRLVFQERTCYADEETSGIPLTRGTLEADGRLCSTRLYLNPEDQDGDSENCSADLGPFERRTTIESTWGPAWSVRNNNGCPLDEVGLTGSLGPVEPKGEFVDDESAALGFGFALELNPYDSVGGREDGRTYLSVFVR